MARFYNRMKMTHIVTIKIRKWLNKRKGLVKITNVPLGFVKMKRNLITLFIKDLDEIVNVMTIKGLKEFRKKQKYKR